MVSQNGKDDGRAWARHVGHDRLRRMGTNWILLAGLAILTIGSGYAMQASARSNDAAVMVRPGDNLQALIDSAGEGATFRFSPGVYRMQQIVPKNNQRFIGRPGVILNGAQIITGWRQENGYWVARAPQERLRPHGVCEDETELCTFREDLFIDGKRSRAVAAVDQVGPGTWYRNDESIFLVDDPAGRLVEMSAAPWAIQSDAKNVVLEQLVVEKYATAAQAGAIDGRYGEDWKLVDVVVQWNHGVGLFLGRNMRVTGGSISNNGQLGIGGDGSGAVIDGVKIAVNNYAGFSAGWEGGGTKFVRSKRLVVRNSCIHDNIGPGLWTDIDNIDITYTNNKVFRNLGDGIKHEISYRALIADNVVARNGKGYDVWLWGSQILIQNSADVEVRNNVVEIAPGYGNGISVVYQERGSGKLGAYDAKNNHIHDNTIIYLGAHGRGGIVADYSIETFWETNSNRFDNNRYIVAGPRDSILGIKNHFGNWVEARAQGFEKNGSLKVQKRTPVAFTCDKS